MNNTNDNTDNIISDFAEEEAKWLRKALVDWILEEDFEKKVQKKVGDVIEGTLSKAIDNAVSASLEERLITKLKTVEPQQLAQQITDNRKHSVTDIFYNIRLAVEDVIGKIIGDFIPKAIEKHFSNKKDQYAGNVQQAINNNIKQIDISSSIDKDIHNIFKDSHDTKLSKNISKIISESINQHFDQNNYVQQLEKIISDKLTKIDLVSNLNEKNLIAIFNQHQPLRQKIIAIINLYTERHFLKNGDQYNQRMQEIVNQELISMIFSPKADDHTCTKFQETHNESLSKNISIMIRKCIEHHFSKNNNYNKEIQDEVNAALSLINPAIEANTDTYRLFNEKQNQSLHKSILRGISQSIEHHFSLNQNNYNEHAKDDIVPRLCEINPGLEANSDVYKLFDRKQNALLRRSISMLIRQCIEHHFLENQDRYNKNAQKAILKAFCGITPGLKADKETSDLFHDTHNESLSKDVLTSLEKSIEDHFSKNRDIYNEKVQDTIEKELEKINTAEKITKTASNIISDDECREKVIPELQKTVRQFLDKTFDDKKIKETMELYFHEQKNKAKEEAAEKKKESGKFTLLIDKLIGWPGRAITVACTLLIILGFTISNCIFIYKISYSITKLTGKTVEIVAQSEKGNTYQGSILKKSNTPPKNLANAEPEIEQQTELASPAPKDLINIKKQIKQVLLERLETHVPEEHDDQIEKIDRIKNAMDFYNSLDSNTNLDAKFCDNENFCNEVIIAQALVPEVMERLMPGENYQISCDGWAGRHTHNLLNRFIGNVALEDLEFSKESNSLEYLIIIKSAYTKLEELLKRQTLSQ